MADIDPAALWIETTSLAREGAFEQITANMKKIAAVDKRYARQVADKLFKRVVNNYRPFSGDGPSLKAWLDVTNRSDDLRNAFARAAFAPGALRAVVEPALKDFVAHKGKLEADVRAAASQIADVLDTVMVRWENAHAAYATLIALRDEQRLPGADSVVQPLINSALSIVAIIKTNGGATPDADHWSENLRALKQKIRQFGASAPSA